MSSAYESPSSVSEPPATGRFPFGSSLPNDREQTVLSQPRNPESGSSNSNPSPRPFTLAAPSSVSMKLFPGQRPAEEEDAVDGETLGHFRIHRRIGAGGMGTVFLADDEKLQRPVALKVLSPQQTADPASVQRFLNEARAAARLDHDHIARVFFYGDDHGLHYIAYEYVQGGNLRDLIRARGRLEPAEVIAYAVQLASALCHTSECGVVHRDIKPSNIIITQQGKAKLVDLGLARKESFEESAQLTVAGTTLGTFDYISPEQAKDPRNVDVRSDIYSLGCTLYHALTGEPPFQDGTVLQRLLDHQDKEPPDPALKNRRVSPAVSAVVRKMMASDPRRRYPNAEALLHDLLVIASAMGLQGIPTHQAALGSLLNDQRSFWSQHLSWIVTAASLVLGAAVWQAFPNWFLPASATSIAEAEPGARSRAALNLASTSTGSRPVPEPGPTSVDAPMIIAEPLVVERSPFVVVPSTEADLFPAETAATSSSPGENRPVVRPQDGAAGALVGTFFPPLNDTLLKEGLLPPSLMTDAIRGSRPPGSADPLGAGPLIGPAVPPAVGSTGNTTSIPERESSGMRTDSPSVAVQSGGTAATATAGPVVDVPASPFVVAGSSKTFTTLEAACAEIRDQGVIELHFDGPLPEPERPLRLVGKRISIEAARGRRPVLWFAPRDSATDPLMSRMIVVSGGSLSLVNVSLELRVRQPAGSGRWALFRLERPERLRLEDVYITLTNPSNVAASVVECAPPATSFAKMGSMKESTSLVATEILMEHSVVRGEANGFWLEDTAPYRCELRQSFFALSEWLMQTEVTADAMAPSVDLTLELAQNTCLLGQGLLRADGADDLSGRQLPIKISARTNVFSCGPSASFIEQQFAQESMEFRDGLRWSGDRNHFDAIRTLWLVRVQIPPDEQRWDFDAWRNYWNSGEISGLNNQPINWASEWRQREWSSISPQAVRADLQADALVSGAVLDEPKTGVDWDLLPTDPPSPTRTP